MKNPNEDYARTSMRLLKALLRHKGEESAITGEQLSEQLGIAPREVAELVGVLTQEGFWVCSGMGYWYAESKEQWIDRQLNKERKRGIEILKKVYKAEKNSVNELNLFDVVAA